MPSDDCSFPPQTVGFSPTYNVLVDQMGLPLSHADVCSLYMAAVAHLGHTDLEIEAIAKRLVDVKCPGMAGQIDWAYYTDGFSADGGKPPSPGGTNV